MRPVSFYRMIFHASASRSTDQAALAGEVDGRHTASRPSVLRWYFRKNFSAVLPLTKIRSIFAPFRMGVRSLGTTFQMELSELPSISQEAMTSHKAMLCPNRKARFSSTV